MGSARTRGVLLLCLLYAGSAWAQDVGRLFTTPEQRSALERLRRGGPAPLAPADAAVAASDARAPVGRADEQVMVINGVVRRSGSGRETTWINSVPYSGTERIAGGVALARGRSNAAVALTLRSGKQVSVSAGQRVDAVSGRVKESYQAPAAAAPRVAAPEDE
jgi:hypothetical protein